MFVDETEQFHSVFYSSFVSFICKTIISRYINVLPSAMKHFCLKIIFILHLLHTHTHTHGRSPLDAQCMFELRATTSFEGGEGKSKQIITQENWNFYIERVGVVNFNFHLYHLHYYSQHRQVPIGQTGFVNAHLHPIVTPNFILTTKIMRSA